MADMEKVYDNLIINNLYKLSVSFPDLNWYLILGWFLAVAMLYILLFSFILN
jgi:hypothetical protein